MARIRVNRLLRSVAGVGLIPRLDRHGKALFKNKAGRALFKNKADFPLFESKFAR